MKEAMKEWNKPELEILELNETEFTKNGTIYNDGFWTNTKNNTTGPLYS